MMELTAYNIVKIMAISAVCLALAFFGGIVALSFYQAWRSRNGEYF